MFSGAPLPSYDIWLFLPENEKGGIMIAMQECIVTAATEPKKGWGYNTPQI
jgi:hypothetical protein